MAAPFQPSPFSFGYYYDEKKDTADKTRELRYAGERQFCCSASIALENRRACCCGSWLQ